MSMNLISTMLNPNLFALSTRVAPRVAQLGNSPSLLALTLVVDGVLALVPALRGANK